MRKQRRTSASRLPTYIVQSLFFLNPEFQAASHLLLMYSLVCVGPGPKPERWLSHDVAHFMTVVGFLQRGTDKLLIRAEQEALNKPPYMTDNETRHIYSGNNRTKNNFQLQELIVRIDTLESDMTTNATENSRELKDNSIRLTRLEAIIFNESVVSDNKFILCPSNETLKNSCVTLNTLNDTVVANEANIDKQYESLAKLEADIEFHETRLSKLETSIDKQKATLGKMEVDIESNGNRLAKLETHFIIENVSLETHSPEIAKLHSDQLNKSEIIKNLTFRVMHLETEIEKQISCEELENRFFQLESDINRTQADIKDNGNDMRLIKENITAEMAFSKTQSKKMNQLESDVKSIQVTVKDYNVTVEKLKVNMHF